MKPITVTISTLEDADCLPEELGEFLFLLKGVYCAVEHFYEAGLGSDINTTIGPPVEEFHAFAKRLSPLQIDQILREDLNDRRLVVKRVVRSSPWQFVLCGVVSSLTLAVILSGGKASIGKFFEFELNALGDGIQKLKSSLGLGRNTTAGFGVETAKIKLSKEEYRELCKARLSEKNRGGFQSFLVSLRLRVNKKTLELELSSSDLTKIKKLKADPKRGGFQSRFQKIFGRHFP